MATAFKQNILFPVGRLVAGSVYEPKIKDHQGNPLVLKRGPDAGKPTQRFDFAVAFAKGNETHFGFTEWGKIVWDVAHQCFPKGQADSPTFAFKIIDGDSTVLNGREKRPCDQPGHAGHWVVWFSSSYPPNLRTADGTRELTEKDAIKRGYFVQVFGNVDGNEDLQKPGVYINHSAVALSGFGEEIVGGQDYSNVGFGAAPLPAGASNVPVAAMNAAPQVPGAAAPPASATPPPAASPSAGLPPSPSVPVQPHSGFRTPPGASPPPPPVAPAPPAGPTMTALANGIPYSAYITNGWTDATLRQHGYLI